MGQKAESTVEIRTFRGMVSNADQHDLQPGQAKVQVNVASTKLGELSIRRGLRELSFDADDA